MSVSSLTPQQRSLPRSLIAGLLLAVLAGAAVGTAWWAFRPADSRPPARPIMLVVSGDTGGWLVPCGCTSNQSGGLLRRGTYVDELRQRAHVIVADAGGAAHGTSPYDRVKFAAILKAEALLGIAAHNLGGPEAAFGAKFLRDTAQQTGVPLLSANLRDANGKPVGEPIRIVNVDGLRVALVGVLSPRFAAADVRIDNPRDAILAVIDDAAKQFDRLIVLAYLPEKELQELAANLPEAHAVIGGPTGQALAPRMVGPTLLAAATNKGKFLIEQEIPRQGPLRAEEGKAVEMGTKFVDAADQKANLKQYLAELEKRDFAANETSFSHSLPAGVPQSYRIAGTAACLKCHADECQVWDESQHARAWETLESRGFQVDAACQQCHTTGFGLPGGFVSSRRSPERTAVGCESCHGPSLTHTEHPRTRTPFDARDRCRTCHDRENSPLFEYAAYWRQIQHGPREEQRAAPRPEKPRKPEKAP